jgi:hypothetical protein
MKKLILLSILFVAFVAAKAQNPLFVKGDKVINLGIGIDSYTTISLSGEYGILDGVADKGTVGVGAFVGYGFELFGNKYYHSSRTLAGVRGTFHYPFIDKLDTYGGLGIGLQYHHWSWDDSYGYLTDYNGSSAGLNAGFFLGARYYLTEKLAAFAEVGYGIGYLTVGVAIKL